VCVWGGGGGVSPSFDHLRRWSSTRACPCGGPHHLPLSLGFVTTCILAVFSFAVVPASQAMRKALLAEQYEFQKYGRGGDGVASAEYGKKVVESGVDFADADDRWGHQCGVLSKPPGLTDVRVCETRGGGGGEVGGGGGLGGMSFFTKQCVP
jgi:hypothetical protein